MKELLKKLRKYEIRIRKEVNSNLYHISYNIEGSDEKLTIATTRPETILGDSGNLSREYT